MWPFLGLYWMPCIVSEMSKCLCSDWWGITWFLALYKTWELFGSQFFLEDCSLPGLMVFHLCMCTFLELFFCITPFSLAHCPIASSHLGFLELRAFSFELSEITGPSFGSFPLCRGPEFAFTKMPWQPQVSPCLFFSPQRSQFCAVIHCLKTGNFVFPIFCPFFWFVATE